MDEDELFLDIVHFEEVPMPTDEIKSVELATVRTETDGAADKGM